ncbi:MAG: tetratricopeptide repeat protein [Gemmataceae bacterium]
MALTTLLVTDLDDPEGLYEQLGDEQAFHLIQDHLRLLEKHIRQEGGTVIKTVNQGWLASFPDCLSAVRVACELPTLLNMDLALEPLRLRIGIHHGPTRVATLNDHLHYSGPAVNLVLQLPQLARAQEVVLTQPVAHDRQVASWLKEHRLQGEPVAAALPDLPDGLVHRVNPLATAAVSTEAPPMPEVPQSEDTVRSQFSSSEMHISWLQVAFRLAREALERLATTVTQHRTLNQPNHQNLRRELLEPIMQFYQRLSQLPGEERELLFERGRALLRLATFLSDVGSRTEAVLLYQQAAQAFEVLVRKMPKSGEYRRALATCYNYLGNLHRGAGQLDLAETAHRQAMTHREQLCQDHPNVIDYKRALASSYNNLANLYRDTARLEEAETAYRQALVIFQELSLDKPNAAEFAVGLGVSFLNMGHLVRDKGDTAGALVWFRRAIETLEGVLRQEPNHPQARQFLDNANWGRSQALSGSVGG